tara:strand:+ start:1935 stop:2237 length:303 start_codon:yes stop_codon:yes gene_type:complete
MNMKRNKSVVCKDGFTMSVQANEGAYCTPRVDFASHYTAVEVGFPSQKEDLLMEWAESPNTPTETVYGWVPSFTVATVIAKHGGMVKGELPPGVIKLKPD